MENNKNGQNFDFMNHQVSNNQNYQHTNTQVAFKKRFQLVQTAQKRSLQEDDVFDEENDEQKYEQINQFQKSLNLDLNMIDNQNNQVKIIFNKIINEENITVLQQTQMNLNRLNKINIFEMMNQELEKIYLNIEQTILQYLDTFTVARLLRNFKNLYTFDSDFSILIKQFLQFIYKNINYDQKRMKFDINLHFLKGQLEEQHYDIIPSNWIYLQKQLFESYLQQFRLVVSKSILSFQNSPFENLIDRHSNEYSLYDLNQPEIKLKEKVQLHFIHFIRESLELKEIQIHPQKLEILQKFIENFFYRYNSNIRSLNPSEQVEILIIYKQIQLIEKDIFSSSREKFQEQMISQMVSNINSYLSEKNYEEDIIDFSSIQEKMIEFINDYYLDFQINGYLDKIQRIQDMYKQNKQMKSEIKMEKSQTNIQQILQFIASLYVEKFKQILTENVVKAIFQYIKDHKLNTVQLSIIQQKEITLLLCKCIANKVYLNEFFLPQQQQSIESQQKLSNSQKYFDDTKTNQNNSFKQQQNLGEKRDQQQLIIDNNQQKSNDQIHNEELQYNQKRMVNSFRQQEQSEENRKQLIQNQQQVIQNQQQMNTKNIQQFLYTNAQNEEFQSNQNKIQNSQRQYYQLLKMNKNEQQMIQQQSNNQQQMFMMNNSKQSSNHKIQSEDFETKTQNQNSENEKEEVKQQNINESDQNCMPNLIFNSNLLQKEEKTIYQPQNKINQHQQIYDFCNHLLFEFNREFKLEGYSYELLQNFTQIPKFNSSNHYVIRIIDSVLLVLEIIPENKIKIILKKPSDEQTQKYQNNILTLIFSNDSKIHNIIVALENEFEIYVQILKLQYQKRIGPYFSGIAHCIVYITDKIFMKFQLRTIQDDELFDFITRKLSKYYKKIKFVQKCQNLYNLQVVGQQMYQILPNLNDNFNRLHCDNGQVYYIINKQKYQFIFDGAINTHQSNQQTKKDVIEVYFSIKKGILLKEMLNLFQNESKCVLIQILISIIGFHPINYQNNKLVFLSDDLIGKVLSYNYNYPNQIRFSDQMKTKIPRYNTIKQKLSEEVIKIDIKKIKNYKNIEQIYEEALKEIEKIKNKSKNYLPQYYLIYDYENKNIAILNSLDLKKEIYSMLLIIMEGFSNKTIVNKLKIDYSKNTYILNLFVKQQQFKFLGTHIENSMNQTILSINNYQLDQSIFSLFLRNLITDQNNFSPF